MTLSSYSSRTAADGKDVAPESRAIISRAELATAMGKLEANSEDSPATLTSEPPSFVDTFCSRSTGIDPLSAASREGGGWVSRVAASTPVLKDSGSSYKALDESAGAGPEKRLSSSSPPPMARSTGEGRANASTPCISGLVVDARSIDGAAVS